jgi:hypothetical protein
MLLEVDNKNIVVVDENHITIFEDLFIRFESTMNGYCYKNEDNFNKKEGVCYIPEYAIKKDVGMFSIKRNGSLDYFYKITDFYPNYYTYDDFMKLCDNNEKRATILFEIVDWQYPESLLYELEWEELEEGE